MCWLSGCREMSFRRKGSCWTPVHCESVKVCSCGTGKSGEALTQVTKESSFLEGLQSKAVSGELLNTHCDEGTEM